MPNRRRLSMPADELVVVVQGHQFVGDAVEKLLMIASRKIGSADRAVKKNVAHQDEFVGVVDENDVTRGMARTVTNFEFQFTNV